MVSVIVPNYCHARFLDQRIQSILNQSYHDFELIILDDCSPDDGASRAVIEKYRDNPHVSQIVYNDVNSGSPFKQWDKGINMAKGELIWIAESDDYCESTFLETLVNEFKRDENLTLAYTLVKRVDAEGKPIRELCIPHFGAIRLSGQEYIKKYMTLDNHCRNASACVFSKAAYEMTDKQYMTYKAGGDMLFWIKIAEHGNVVIVNNKLSNYRIHSQKLTPKSSRYGINMAEYKKTYDYILRTQKISRRRQELMKVNVLYKLKHDNYDNENIRKELLAIWNLPDKINYISLYVLMICRSLQARLGLYI